jgi:RHS repeat-associated protein
VEGGRWEITSRTYPDGTSVSYGYNSDLEPVSMTVGSAQSTYTYNAAMSSPAWTPPPATQHDRLRRVLHLAGTGLDDMQARDYSPATGQFTSVDPLLAETGTPYAYADDNPVTLLDPTGLAWWDSPVITGIGAVALTVINGLQLGADPLTDGLEIADVAALTGEVAGAAADDESGELAAEGDPLQEYAEANRTSDSRFASEYISPCGQTYYDVNASCGPVPEDHPLGPLDHHGGCSEIGCLLQAAASEGARGGSMRTIYNRPPNTPIPPGPPTGQGAPASPCPLCQAVLDSLGITF